MREMKDSGIEWIGQAPMHWKCERIQWYLQEINESNDPVQTSQILSLTNKLGVIPYEEKGNQGNKSKEDLSQYKIAYPDCIVVNSMNILIGSVGLCNYYGCVSPAYYVFKAKENADIRYFNYLFGLSGFQRELRRYANGILEIRLRVSSANILKRKVMIPPLSEQSAIAAYLDIQCAQIDEIIAEAKASIEEYKQWKASVIYEAVTKGLEPDVEMKDSGTEFGYIPNSWSIMRLKNIATAICKGSGITKEDVIADGEISCIRYGEIYSKYNYIFEVCLTRTNEDRAPSKRYFSYGDILFAGTGESVEEIGKNVVYLGNELCLAGGDIVVVKHEQNPIFLSFALNSCYGQAQKSNGKAKLKVVHISSSDIGNMVVFLPPIEKQNAIADYLRAKNTDIDTIIAEKEALISDLESYKKSLIYEVVTGKRKVC